MNMIPRLVNRWLRTREVVNEQSPIGPELSRTGVGPALAGNDWFVDAQRGSDTADGRNPAAPMKTITAVLAKCFSGDTIYVVGNVTEEITASNLLEDISIIGVGNRPRHADKARDFATYPTYKGISGCSWRQAASHGATTPLLKIRGQGWHIENILFVPPSDAAAIYLDRNALSNVSEYDASHAEIVDCRFAGGQNAIDVTDCFNVHLKGNTFQDATAAAITSTGQGVAQPLMPLIEDNEFNNNDTHISVAYSRGTIKHNTFGKFTTLSIDLTDGGAGGGGNNVVWGNYLFGTYSAVGGYVVAAASDEWGGNFNVLTGGVTAADPG